jgi:hypothetical protein
MSKPALSAILVVILANWGRAQNQLSPATVFPASPAPRTVYPETGQCRLGSPKTMPVSGQARSRPQVPRATFESGSGGSDSRALWISEYAIHDTIQAPLASAEFTSFTQPPPGSAEGSSGGAQIGDAQRFAGQFSAGSRPFSIGVDLYSPPEFEGGLIVFGRKVAMKIGGYVKADFIYDFDPIDSTDSFVTTSIPVGAPPRTNARFHARQSRLSFDTRWASNQRTVRIFLEGDFFSDEDRYRLRHAYGELGSLLVGQTWTTFTDVAAIPATLDLEGSVSTVKRRQAQARWTQPILCEGLSLSLAVEDTRFVIETPVGIEGDGNGSYRGLPDAAPSAVNDIGLLPLFAWMVGITHDWSDRLSSNFTYAENNLDTTVFQNPDDAHRITYLAANLIWSPLDRVKVGIEYLYGLRENVDRAVGSANRLHVAFIFGLP